MQTYLFTWNPRRWRWTDFDELVSKIERDGRVLDRWSSGVTRKIFPGDRFFLMRLGVPPKGIIGGGVINSKPFHHRHWRAKEAIKGNSAIYVDIFFEWLLPAPAIALERLEAPEFQPFNWTPRASGSRIPENIAQQLHLLSPIRSKVK